MVDITLKLTIENPFPGVSYSLQDAKGAPVGTVVATDAPLSLEVPARLGDDAKLSGAFIRREGRERRFVYIAVGRQTGDTTTLWDRRAKIDVHDLPSALLDAARGGQVLACRLPGAAKDGGPSCGTVRPIEPWRVWEE